MAHQDHDAVTSHGRPPATAQWTEQLADLRHRLRPGARVRVIQQIAARHYAWGTAHAGTVLRYEQKQTGSWYAHSRGEKLWLDRLVMKKDDGEIFTFNLDEYTHIDVLADAPAGEPSEDLQRTSEQQNVSMV